MATAKTTLTHLTESGQVATRKTARDYGFVVVAVEDVSRELAYLEQFGNSDWAERHRAYVLNPVNAHRVASWHRTRELAEKFATGNSAESRALRHNTVRVYVEAVNGGQR